jgi:hypothetical protein
MKASSAGYGSIAIKREAERRAAEAELKAQQNRLHQKRALPTAPRVILEANSATHRTRWPVQKSLDASGQPRRGAERNLA